MKDNFSSQAKEYAQFRPGYPDALFDFLIPLVKNLDIAWDCGTGNGQIAARLSNYFKHVYATDISHSQISNAAKRDNITYSSMPAEKVSFPDKQFDLITIAQAIHWFRFEKFYAEVNRTVKPNGLIAVIGYGLVSIDKEIDLLINDLYSNTLSAYWDKERRYIDEDYKTIPFPFQEIATPSLFMRYTWTIEQLTGYLYTWSAVQHYINKSGTNPIDMYLQKLKLIWPEGGVKEVCFPILLRVGVVT